MKQACLRYKGIIFFLLLLVGVLHKPIMQSYFILNYKPQIIAYSKHNGLNPALISAIIFTESRFNASAQSSKGALGLMQVMPATGRWVAGQLQWHRYSHKDLLNPSKNLEVGVWYLAYLKRYFNQNEGLALASYNAGHRYVSQWLADRIWDGDVIKLENIPFPETKNYVLRISFLKKIYAYLYPELRVPPESLQNVNGLSG
ncbi:MAG TPA: lytic transglycosylase domain-containing protein [Bacillota bacterium]